MDNWFGSFNGGGGRRFRPYGGMPWFDVIMIAATVVVGIVIALHFDAVTLWIANAVCQILLFAGGVLLILFGILILVLIVRIIFRPRRWY